MIGIRTDTISQKLGMNWTISPQGMFQLFQDKDAGSFTDNQTLSPLIKGLTTFRINQLETAESTKGYLTKRVTPTTDHHISQTPLNHLISHTKGSRT